MIQAMSSLRFPSVGWFPSAFVQMAPLPLSGSLLSDQHATPAGEPTGPRIQEVLVDLIDYSQNNCGDHFIDGMPVDETVYMLDTEQIDPLKNI